MNILADLSLTLLGPTQITLDGRHLTFRTNKVMALLCFLAVETANQPGISFRREALMELLWPAMPLKSAQDNLRQTLYQLRKTIPETTAANSRPQPLVLSDRLTIRLNPACAYKLDTAGFQAHFTSEPSLTALEQAAALYRGDFLADFYLPDSSAFEDWAAAHRLDLRNQALAALDKLSAAYLENRQFIKAEAYAWRQLEIDNLRESAHRQLMTILFEDGRRSAALQQYDRCRQLLLDELGVEPSAETTALYQQIRAGRQLGERPTPTHHHRQRRHNLPAQTTSFVGRQEELSGVTNLLLDPNCRLLTLLGPGGIGKTRLSLQAAAALAQSENGPFPDGIFVVPLAAVPAMDYFVPAVAEGIGFSFSGPREPKKQLLNYLKDKQILLVLDNLEHLAGEAGLLTEFLSAVPHLTFLVTSRARLNLYEEWHFELKGLAVPTEEAANLEAYSAVQLFLQRARQAGLAVPSETDLPIIGRICRLLAGMPLGIELAAGWVRTHTCAQIAAEIERSLDFLTTTIKNIPERHRSLHVVFEHSWRLLPAEAQQILARAAVFRGGFDREAAQFVAGASPIDLAGLADNSILQVTGGRFHMNELLRQFAAEKLTGKELPAVQERHSAHYAAFLERREPHKWTAREPAALQEINLELQNILAGWQWAVAVSADSDTGLVLIGRYSPMLGYFFDQRSRYHEGVHLFQRAAGTVAAGWSAPLPQKAQTTLALVRTAEAVLRFHLSQFSEVENLLTDSLAAFREAGRRQETAQALLWLGLTHNRLGAFDEAERRLHQSLALFEEIDEGIAGAEALNGLGIVAISQERFEEAQHILELCLSIYKETGYQRGIARALSNMATGRIRSGNVDPAMPLYEEALAAARAINDVMVTAVVLCNMGSASRLLGRYEESCHFYQESQAMFEEMGERRWIAVSLNGLGETLLDMGRLQPAEQRLRQSLEISTAIQSLPDILDSLAALGQISAATGHSEQAIITLTFVAQNPVTKPLSRQRSNRVLANLEKTSSLQLWEKARSQGKQMTVNELTALY